MTTARVGAPMPASDPPPKIQRVRALNRIKAAYEQLLAATAELAEIDAEVLKTGGHPPQTLIPAQIRAALLPHLHRIGIQK
jgi:hypothetical protein